MERPNCPVCGFSAIEEHGRYTCESAHNHRAGDIHCDVARSPVKPKDVWVCKNPNCRNFGKIISIVH